jgi:hypothetical protein
MGERRHYETASGFAEMMLFIFEAEYARGERDLDGMMRRLKDLSAYSLTHAEIMDQREGAELLALGMFFGASSQKRYLGNQARLHELSEETIAYEGKAEVIVQEIAGRKADASRSKKDDDMNPLQPRLL